MSKIYAGDSGFYLKFLTGVNLTGASLTQISVKKPNGITVTWMASIDSVNNQQLNYLLQPGDLDQIGTYAIQANVDLDIQILFGDTDSFIVYQRFS